LPDLFIVLEAVNHGEVTGPKDVGAIERHVFEVEDPNSLP
jgi:hypothetical protein